MNNKLKMNNISKFIGLCAATAAILSGCAKQEATKTNSTEKLYFDSWIHVWNSEHQTKAVEHGNGIYILEDEPGTGSEWNPSAHTFAYLDVTVSDLDGNISSTTSEKVAKKIGTYKETYYYGPKINTITEGGCYVGLEDALKGMKMGGRRKVAIPSWLLTGTRYDNKEEYLKHSVDASNAIYDIKLVDMMADVYKWETDSMEVFVAKYMDGVDSTYFAGDSTALKYGFYFQTVKEGTTTQKMSTDTTFYVNYTGRLMNGRVFDTTIADTAKVWGLYDATKTYEPVEITMDEKLTEIQMEGTSSLQDGFQAGVSMLHNMETARVAFYSAHGYSYSGMGSAIPPFSPLCFEFQVVESK